ncbi:MAG: hypothetical protein ACRC9T_00100 [Vibrionaceae bacterium]
MSDKLNEMVKEIALKHGITVSRDDPIMILHTLNERLIQENAAAQKAHFDTFKSELEEIAHKWSHDAKNKADRTLNAALIASKEVMTAATEENAKTIALTVKQEIETTLDLQLQSAISQARRLSLISLTAAAMAILAASVTLWLT